MGRKIDKGARRGRVVNTQVFSLKVEYPTIGLFSYLDSHWVIHFTADFTRDPQIWLLEKMLYSLGQKFRTFKWDFFSSLPGGDR